MSNWRKRVLGRVFRAVPAPLREFAVRRTTPSYVMGAMCRLERDDGRVLLVKPSYRSVWTMPGGVSERGESPIDCMRRELREETGIECDVVGEPVVLLDPARRILDFVYRARLRPGADPSEARATSLEIAEVGWFHPEEIPAVSGQFAPKALSVGSASDVARIVIVEPETEGRMWWRRR